MIDTRTLDTVAARRAWLGGGSLLLAAVVFRSGSLPFGLNLLGPLFYVVALLIFAFGYRRAGSVTARRPLGTIAIVTLAAWNVAVLVINSALVSDALPDGPSPLIYVEAVVPFAIALVVVTQIGRAGVVPAPWNWAPALALAAVTASWLLEQLASVPLGSATVTAVLAIDSILHLGVLAFLGGLAVFLAGRMSRPDALASRAANEGDDAHYGEHYPQNHQTEANHSPAGLESQEPQQEHA